MKKNQRQAVHVSPGPQFDLPVKAVNEVHFRFDLGYPLGTRQFPFLPCLVAEDVQEGAAHVMYIH